MTESETKLAPPAAVDPVKPAEQQVQATPPVDVPPAPGKQQTPIVDPAVKPADAKATDEPVPAPADATPYELTQPDGDVVDSGVVSKFAEVAHRSGITKDVAQQILADLAPTIAARAQENVKTMIDGWKAASAADKRFGGPTQAAAVDARIDRGLTKLGSPELRTLIDQNGLRHHPEFRAFLAAAGSAVSEDSKVVQPSPAPKVTRVNGMTTPASAAQVMFGRNS